MGNVLVVGSLVYDSISTPAGKVKSVLGGSANYFSLAASVFAKVRVVGVVGEDYQDSDRAQLLSRGVDLEGMKKVPGKTFQWEGKYEGDLNEAQSLRTDLNVFADFNPVLPESYRDSEFVFLANIAPDLQLKVLDQVKDPIFVGMDTMNFWISSQIEVLKKVIERVPMVLLNETEAKMITGASNAVAAAPILASMGKPKESSVSSPGSDSKFVIIKRGEYGFLLYSAGKYFMLPAVPVTEVIDPTGAGDSFAGGVFGYLANLGRKPTFQDLKKACLRGTVMGSFTIQDFGTKALAQVTPGTFEERLKFYLKSTSLADN